MKDSKNGNHNGKLDNGNSQKKGRIPAKRGTAPSSKGGSGTSRADYDSDDEQSETKR